jgi:hypothetical protein
MEFVQILNRFGAGTLRKRPRQTARALSTAAIWLLLWLGAADTALAEPSGQKATASPATGAVLDLGNGLRTAEWDAFGYGLADGPQAREFNLEFVLRRRSQADSAVARVVFNVQDSRNYTFAEFAADAVRLGRVESGLEQPIGASGSFGLSRGPRLKAILKRRALAITVILDDEIAARAFDDTFSGGKIGGGSKGGAVGIEDVRLQPLGGLYFADDFMRGSGDTGGWEQVNGQWDVFALDNPTRSVNAFSYVVGKSSEGALAVAGYRFWDSYRFRTAVKGSGSGTFGVAFCYLDAKSHFRFQWDSQDAPEAERKMHLLAVREAKESVLGERPSAGYRSGQWYEIQVEAWDGRVRVSVDEMPVFDVRSANVYGGRVGLFSRSGGETFFDDVVVEPLRDFSDDFSAESGSTWLTLGGDWRAGAGQQGSAGNPVFRPNAAAEAKAVCGSAGWRRYAFEADVGPWDSGAAGLLFAYLDEASYGLMRMRMKPNPEAELVYVADGREEVLDRAAVPEMAGKGVRAAVSVDDGLVTAHVAGRRVLQAWKAGARSGRAGLFASGTSAAFDNALARFHEEHREPVLTMGQFFAADTAMANWAAAQGDWYAATEKSGDATRATWWHRVSFPGSTDVWIALQQPAVDKGQLSLFLAATEEKAGSGYEVSVSAQNGWIATVRRLGAEVAKGQVGPGTKLGLVRVRREGAFLVVYLDEAPVVAWKDPSPLTGSRLGYYATDLPLGSDSVEVFSDDVLLDNFTKAPSQWRVGGGAWAVSRRWQCDPRWSFFCGSSDDKAAVLWHKRRFSGDLTLEFAAAIQMDNARGLGYSYARDLNVTLCADGQSLDSGYSFVFGGWKNTKAAIVRGTKVVAEAPKPLISGNIHYAWWLLRVEKRGPTFRYFVDNEQVLEYTDPNPLAGDRVAVWTYRNGMMLARFRVAGSGEKPLESPEQGFAASCKCFYDGQSQ